MSLPDNWRSLKACPVVLVVICATLAVSFVGATSKHDHQIIHAISLTSPYRKLKRLLLQALKIIIICRRLKVKIFIFTVPILDYYLSNFEEIKTHCI